eukprot:Polyplicarium_translucidae@DN1087_c0_g1_i1.p1
MYALEKFLLQGAVLAAASAPFVSDHSDEIGGTDRAAIEGGSLSCDGFNAAVTKKDSNRTPGTWKATSVGSAGLKLTLKRCKEDDQTLITTPYMQHHEQRRIAGRTGGALRRPLTCPPSEQETPLLCDRCAKTFKTRRQLTDHVNRDHRVESVFSCAHCFKSFTSKRCLTQHIRRIHDNEARRYMCDRCSRRFVAPSKLKEHMLTHTGNRFECNYCDKTFAHSCSAAAHTRAVHQGRREFECEVCSVRFSKTTNLKAHMRTHTDERPFKCGTCSKAFKAQNTLTRHRVVHTGAKPFECEICQTRFCRRGGLTKHNRIHHAHT